ncbi:hypothetical protein FHS43_001248 [Streptosporangium becharense]|uniref:DUF6286 domain-containing protein n=1 Tax=Streptosporangium becharense TaxID=1816182 RepID=A0A7W9MG65_9ACTN|nr:DUF6286 domain-containing protein [Streptosporangium becharense]MBB2910002.1 hypothetical protein [Streptosporangium becharense]MBB5819043.1 hypothetical protein [Streptosporangium becharense]
MTTTLHDTVTGTGSGAGATGGAGRAGRANGESPHAARRRSVRLLRAARTPAAVPVALVVSAALCSAAVVTVGLLTGSPAGRVPYRRLATRAGEWHWSDPATFVAAVLAIFAGLVLLGLAALPGRPRLEPLESADPLTVIGMTRSGLRRTLRAAAESVDEVDRARVRLASRIVEVTVFTGTERTGPLLRRVGAAVGDRMAALGVTGAGEVVVRLRRRGA